MTVDDGIGPDLAAGLEGLLRLEVGPGDAVQPRVVAADPGPHTRAELAGSLRHLVLELGDEMSSRLDVGDRLGRPQDGEGARIGGKEEAATPDLQRFGHLRERLASTLAVAVAHHELADDRAVTGGPERSVRRTRL